MGYKHKTPDKKKKDIPFHVCPRLDREQVVLNSKNNGKWGKEKNETPDFPLVAGGPFHVLLRVLKDGYSVSNHFCIAKNRYIGFR